MDKKAKKKRSKIDMSDSGSAFVRDPDKGKKKKEERKKEHAADKISDSNETLGENCTGDATDKQTCSIEGHITLMGNKEDENHENKRKKKNRRKDVEATNSNIADDKEVQFLDDNQERKMKKRKKNDCSLKNNEGEDDDQGKHMKKKRKKKKLGEENRPGECNEFKGSDLKDECQDKKKMKKKEKKKEKKKKLSEEGKSKESDEFKTNEGEADDQGKQMKKKKKSVEESQHKESIEFKGNEHKDEYQDKKMKKEERKKKQRDKSKSKENSEFNEGDPPLARVTEVDDQGKKMKVKKDKAGSGPGSSKPKRVTFSDQVDICCDGLVRGKRFTPEEDEKIKAAVHDYIESHGLGDEGVDMILHCKSHPEVRNCWKEIGAALPDRPNLSVYYRAHILFERDEKRKWTPEELDFLRKVQDQHGSDWKSVAEALGKHRFHVKDAWRRIKLTNTNKGRWTQEEYQNLFDLVNLDLCARASEGYRKSKHGMLRDNIGWEAIGDKLATRTSARCCKKWYDHLTSPMVANGDWSDADDYRMLNALFTLDACSMEEVDWDNLLEHRPGDVCRKRWNQMVRYIGEHGGKPFSEQVEVLANRFCPNLMEVREAFDEKPVVC